MKTHNETVETNSEETKVNKHIAIGTMSDGNMNTSRQPQHQRKCDVLKVLNGRQHISLKELYGIIVDFGRDHDVLKLALRKNCHALCLASDEIREDKGFVLSLLSYDKTIFLPLYNPEGVFRNISTKLRDDQDVVHAYTKRSPGLIQYASNKCRDNSDTMLLTITRLPKAIRFASERLLNNPDFIIEVMKKGCCAHLAMKHASVEVRDNPAVVLAAVQENGSALEFASARLCEDEDIALAAVASKTRAANFVARRYLNNKEFMQTAIQKNQYLVGYASKNLQADKDFITWILKLEGISRANCDAMHFACPSLRDDADVVWTAVCRNPESIKFASERLKNDKTIILFVVQRSGLALRFASQPLKRDWDVVSTAMENNYQAIRLVSTSLLDNEDFALLAIQEQARARKSEGGPGKVEDAFEILPCLSERVRCRRKVVMSAINSGTDNGYGGLKYASPNLKNDLSVVLNAVSLHASSYLYASKDMQENPQVIRKAILNYNYPVSDFVKCYLHQGVKRKMAMCTQALQRRHETYNVSPHVQFANQSEITSYLESWSTSIWETIWLINQRIATDRDASRKVVEFVGIHDQLADVRQLWNVAPVIGAIVERGMHWTDIRNLVIDSIV